RVRDEIDGAAVGVAAHGADLVDEWIARAAAATQVALLDELEEVVDRKIARAGERAASLPVEEARCRASGQKPARGRGGLRPRAGRRVRAQVMTRATRPRRRDFPCTSGHRAGSRCPRPPALRGSSPAANPWW